MEELLKSSFNEIMKMSQKTINISIDRPLWDALGRFAHEQSLLQDKRFSNIEALRTAIQVFLRLEIKEVNQILERNTRT